MQGKELPSIDDDDSYSDGDSALGHSIYEALQTDSRDRETEGAGSSFEVEVETPTSTGSSNNTPHVQRPMMDIAKGLQNIVSNLSTTISSLRNCRSCRRML